MAKVFISHATCDQTLLESTILPLLRRAGIEYWYYETEMRATGRIDEQIHAALEECCHFMVLIGQEACRSTWVKDELFWALAHRYEQIVPVLIHDCDPSALSFRLLRIPYIDYRSPCPASHRKLVKAIDPHAFDSGDSLDGMGAVLIAHHSQDEGWRNRIAEHLRPFDCDIITVDETTQSNAVVLDAAQRADVAVLLLSGAFMYSDVLLRNVIREVCAENASRSLPIIPVATSLCAVSGIKRLRKFARLPEDGVWLADIEDDAMIHRQLVQIADVIGSHLDDEPDDAPADDDEPAAAAGDGSDNSTDDSSDDTDFVRTLLDLLGRGSAATPPENLAESITDGIEDVAKQMDQLSAGNSNLSLQDIIDITGVAISHGAGIYNYKTIPPVEPRPGPIGCAKIYHRAASWLAEYSPPIDAPAGGQPLRDAALAMDWLHRIVEATPTVLDETADDLAWELRYAFDSIRAISLLDSATDAFEEIGPSVVEVRSLLAQVFEHAKRIKEPHVAVYLLRHVTQLLAVTIRRHYSLDPALRELAARASKSVQSCRRIVRGNERQDHQLFVSAIAAIDTALG